MSSSSREKWSGWTSTASVLRRLGKLAMALRAEGVSADYQHDREHRNWIGERSAAAIALALSSALRPTPAGLRSSDYSPRRTLTTTVRGSRPGTQRGDTISWEWYEFEGKGEEVAQALDQIGPPPERPPLKP